MEQRLKALKEQIASFVRDYVIEDFDIWLQVDGNIDKTVTLGIRV